MPGRSLMDVLCDASNNEWPESSFLSLTEKRFDFSETCDKSNSYSAAAFMSFSHNEQNPQIKPTAKREKRTSRQRENRPPTSSSSMWAPLGCASVSSTVRVIPISGLQVENMRRIRPSKTHLMTSFENSQLQSMSLGMTINRVKRTSATTAGPLKHSR